MPPPRSENDLKRLARRRLIGAVALTLLAVIVLPLLLEDEPPPASSLAVRMATAPEAPAGDPASRPSVVTEQTTDESTETDDSTAATPAASDESPAAQTTVGAAHGPTQERQPAVPETAASKPDRPQPVARAVVPSAAKPASSSSPAPAAAAAGFVVQLAALSDPAKARALKTRAAAAGLPAYTDQSGALTRVRIGPYPSRSAAVAAAVKLAESGLSGQVLAQ